MALIHKATIRPTKLELLDAWAPSQPWFEGEADTGLTLVASFRFDDPDGEVGIETLLVRAGNGPVLQVPLTYRGAPLEGGDAWLITTMEHSVLGPRWVYDAEGDPVYRAALATTVLTGGREADQYVESDGAPVLRESTATVVGSGSDAEGPAGKARIDLVRAPDTDAPDLPPVTDGSQTEILTATWTDRGTRSATRVLARVRILDTKVQASPHRHHHIDYIELAVLDVVDAKNFYSEAFGWTFVDYGPEYAGIRDLAVEGGEIGGLRLAEAVHSGGPLVLLFSDDLDASVTRVLAAGGKIATGPYEFPGGRRFHFMDPSGNELGVWAKH